jgi:hypothetical protein
MSNEFRSPRQPTRVDFWQAEPLPFLAFELPGHPSRFGWGTGLRGIEGGITCDPGGGSWPAVVRLKLHPTVAVEYAGVRRGHDGAFGKPDDLRSNLCRWPRREPCKYLAVPDSHQISGS